MRRSLFRCLGLALCVLPLATVPSSAQMVPRSEWEFLAVPDFAKETFSPDSTIQAQATTTAPAFAPFTISPNTGMPILAKTQNLPEQENPAKYQSVVQLALMSNEYVDERFIENSRHRDEMDYREKMCTACQEQLNRFITGDLHNFYCSENTIFLGIAVAGVAPIANTHADVGFRNWYQAQAGHAARTNDVAQFINDYVALQIVLPAEIAFSAIGHLFPDNAYAAIAGEFGDRSLRALAVGAPMVGILEVGLGSSGPGSNDSSWHPFRAGSGVSGNAFVGAVPFLTAAAMAEDKTLQTALFLASFATSWSHIQTDDHYLSQAILGWACAYFAVRAVNQTEGEANRNIHFVPLPVPNGAGVGVLIQY